MRQFKQQETRTVTEQRRNVLDTYIRPTVSGADRLGELAALLKQINPVIKNYKEEAAQARYNKEVAEGYAASANFAPDEVPADKFYRYSSVNANEYAKRSRAFQHGVNIHEMQTLANTLPTAADEWFRTAKTTDGKRISEIEDPVEFNKAYRNFTTQYINQKTGGQFDPLLYEKYLGPSVTQTEHNVTQQFLSERRKAMNDRAVAAFMGVFNSSVKDTFQTDAYLDDREGYVANAAKTLIQEADALASQIGPKEAGDVVTNALASLLTDADTTRELADIEQIANKIRPTWANDKNQLQFEKAKETATLRITQANSHAEAEARRAERERKYEERMEQEDAAFAFMEENPSATKEQFNEHFKDLDPATRHKLWRTAGLESRQNRAELKHKVESLRVPPDKVEELYNSGEIDKETYQSFKTNLTATQKKAITPLVKELLSSFALKELPDSLKWTGDYLEAAAYDILGELFEKNNVMTELINNKVVSTKMEKTIMDAAEAKMQKLFGTAADLGKAVNDWRMTYEEIKPATLDSVGKELNSIDTEVTEGLKGPDKNDFDMYDQLIKLSNELVSNHLDLRGTFPSYGTFMEQLGWYTDVNPDQFETFLKNRANAKIKNMRDFYDYLVHLYLEGVPTNQNGSNPKRTGNTITGSGSQPTNPADSSDTGNTFFNDESDT